MAQLEKVAEDETFMVNLMAELESQSACPYIGDCKVIQEHGLNGIYCGDFGSFCKERIKRDKDIN